MSAVATDFEEGLLVGLLVGEGHFGGDGRQPQVTLRMHIRHEAMFRWLERTFPGGRLYGPYEHSGRRYFQWMARGPFLRDELLPLLVDRLSPELDQYAHHRLQEMREAYPRHLSRGGSDDVRRLDHEIPLRDGAVGSPGLPAPSANRSTAVPGPDEVSGRQERRRGAAPSRNEGAPDVTALFQALRRHRNPD